MPPRVRFSTQAFERRGRGHEPVEARSKGGPSLLVRQWLNGNTAPAQQGQDLLGGGDWVGDGSSDTSAPGAAPGGAALR